jgi:hypothetical protein
MALVKCPDCSSQFSSAAKACPQCGRPHSTISWLTIGVVVGVVVLGWIGLQMGERQSLDSGSTPALAADSIVQPQAPGPCVASRFSVEEVHIPKRRYGLIWFVGVVRNDNAVPCAVELQGSGYGADGSMLNTTDFWPASTSNIDAGAKFNFRMSMDDVAAIERIEVMPISARQW